FKVFEVNIRQGRSSYYVDACGYPMASMFVDDLIHEKHKPLAYVTKPMLFTVVPKAVLKKYVKDPALKKEIKARLKAGEVVNPLFYKYDTNFKRKLYLAARQVNYMKKYRSSNWQGQ
ncbi:MAG TPA: carboxylate--amine ligase, partial [Metalysinibacillus sp.]